MPIPPNAVVILQPMAPADVLDVLLPISKGSMAQEPTPFLLDGEDVASFTMATTAEAAAAGLLIKSGGAYGPSIIDNRVLFWVAVAPAQQGSALFLGEGVKLGVEVTITTTNTPPRVKQRTIQFQVAKQ